MKILMINTVCGITSTGRICTDLASLAEKQGHTCRIAYARGAVPTEYQKYALKIGSDFDVRLHAIGSRLFDNTGFYSKKSTKNLIRRIKEYNPDLIHLHNLHGYYINLPTLFSYLKSAGKPIIWTLHDCWSYTGHCTCYDMLGCRKWKTGCDHCPSKRDYPASFLLDGSALNYRRKKELFCGVPNLTLVTPSQWLADEVKQSFLRDYPVKVLPSGIDRTVFCPTEGDFRKKYGLLNKRIILGVANIWNPRKGIKDFIALSEKLQKNDRIVLVGDLRGQTVPENIICIAHTDSTKQLAEIYSAADVFVNPSYEETQGLTTVEAMSCGTPVVVYDRTALPESVYQTGCFVVEAGNIEMLLDAVNKTDSSLSEVCLEKAKTYEKQTCFLKYIKLYEEVIDDFIQRN